MGTCASCCQSDTGSAAERKQLVGRRGSIPEPASNWGSQLADDLKEPLKKSSVANDFPRLVTSIFVDALPTDSIFVVPAALPMIVKTDVFETTRRNTLDKLIRIAALVGDNAIAHAMSTYTDPSPQGRNDVGPFLREMLGSIVPDHSSTAVVLKCTGQGIVCTPMKRLRHLLYNEHYCTRMQDAGLWNIHVYLVDDGVEVCHSRLDSGNVDFKNSIQRQFVVGWQLRIRLRWSSNAHGRSLQISHSDLSVRTLSVTATKQAIRTQIIENVRKHWPNVTLTTPPK